MQITFYGVRGSTPAAGPKTAKYGGNTSCVHIELDSGQEIILDSGTGIRLLGQKLVRKTSPINIIISHSHWDHIQGYPTFAPLYQPDRKIDMFTCAVPGDRVLQSVVEQMNGLNFPVSAKQLPSNLQLHHQRCEAALGNQKINIVQKPLNHPGGGSAYRIEEDGVSCAYVTDNELDPPYKQNTTYDQWVEYLSGVDVLIHDAQYLENDMPHKHGWGHSLISQVRQLAIDAEVNALVMFHHDPDRTDTELDEIQIENEAHFKGKRAPAKSYCAAEGMQLTVSKSLVNGNTDIKVC